MHKTFYGHGRFIVLFLFVFFFKNPHIYPSHYILNDSMHNDSCMFGFILDRVRHKICILRSVQVQLQNTRRWLEDIADGFRNSVLCFRWILCIQMRCEILWQNVDMSHKWKQTVHLQYNFKPITCVIMFKYSLTVLIFLLFALFNWIQFHYVLMSLL